MLIPIGKSACVKTHLKIFDTDKKKVFMMNLKSLQELDSRQYKVYGIYFGTERDYTNFLPITNMIKQLDEVSESGKMIPGTIENKYVLLAVSDDLSYFGISGISGNAYKISREQMKNLCLSDRMIGVRYDKGLDMFEIKNKSMYPNIEGRTANDYVEIMNEVDKVLSSRYRNYVNLDASRKRKAEEINAAKKKKAESKKEIKEPVKVVEEKEVVIA